jgi:threonine synthase
MRYISTRGHASSTPDSSGRTFTEILLGGLAPDGGLYLPESYPQVSPAELEQWRRLSYADLAYAVLSSFIDDIPQPI